MTSIDYSAYQDFFTAIQNEDLRSWDCSTLEGLWNSAQQRLPADFLGNPDEPQVGTFSGLIGALRWEYGDDESLPMRIYWLLTGGYPDAWIEGEWYVINFEGQVFYSSENHRDASWEPYPVGDGQADVPQPEDMFGDQYADAAAVQPAPEDITESADLIAEALNNAGLGEITEGELAAALSNLIGAGQR